MMIFEFWYWYVGNRNAWEINSSLPDPGAGLIPGKTVLHVSQDTKARNVKNLLPKMQRVKKGN